MAAASGNATSAAEEAGKVAKVASKLRVFEDFGLAYRLQEQEFGTHYDHNRHERRLVGSDTKKSKEEQELEDKYAAEYRAQVLRDLAEKDGEVALQVQMELEREEQRKREELARIDQEIARRIQTEEASNGYREPRYDPTEDERLARQLQQSLNASSPAASRAPEPFGFRASVVNLPARDAPEGRRSHNSALMEEDKHYAKYVQDRELAKYEQRKERERQRYTEEQRQNEINLAAASGRPIAAIGGRRRSSTDSSAGSSSNTSHVPPPRPPPPKFTDLRRSDMPPVYNAAVGNPSVGSPPVYNAAVANPSVYSPPVYNGAVANPSAYNPPVYNAAVANPPVANLISFDADDLPPPPAPLLPLQPTNPFLQDLQNESFPPPPLLDGSAVGNSMTSSARVQGGADIRPTYKPPTGAVRVLPHRQ